MDQSEGHGKKLRHSKEDKKRYRKRRKLKKKGVEGALPYKMRESSTVAKRSKIMPNARARAMVDMAVKRNPRSTFLHVTPTLRSALLPSQRDRHPTNKPKSSLAELNRNMLSYPNGKDILLGEGTYGVTRLMYFNGNLPVAVKQYKANDLYEVKKEAGIILELQQQYHPNLPYVLGICVREKPYLMITQFYGKGFKSYSLSKAIERKIVDFDILGNIFKQIVDALIYVHEAGWLHNDIKENNVLLHKMTEEEWKPVIIDFGKSRPQTNPKRYQLTDAQRAFYKTKHPWIAPELIDGTHTQSRKTDVYSLGVLLQSMLSKFVQQNFTYENLSARCIAPQPTRISLKELKDEL